MGSAASVLCLEGHFPGEFGVFLSLDPGAVVPSFAFGFSASSFPGVLPVFLHDSAVNAVAVRELLDREDPETVARMTVFVDGPQAGVLGADGLQQRVDQVGLDHYVPGLSPGRVAELVAAGGGSFVPVDAGLAPVAVEQAVGVRVRPVEHVLARLPSEKRAGGVGGVFPAMRDQVRFVPGGVQIGLTPSMVDRLVVDLAPPERAAGSDADVAVAGYGDLVRLLDGLTVGDRVTIYADAGGERAEFLASRFDAGVAVWQIVDGAAVAATLPIDPVGLRLVLPGGLDHQAVRDAFDQLVELSPVSAVGTTPEDVKVQAGRVLGVMRARAAAGVRGVLVNPVLVPDGFQATFNRLSNRSLSLPDGAGVDDVRNEARKLLGALGLSARDVAPVLDADLNGPVAHENPLVDAESNPLGVNARGMWDELDRALNELIRADFGSEAEVARIAFDEVADLYDRTMGRIGVVANALAGLERSSDGAEQLGDASVAAFPLRVPGGPSARLVAPDGSVNSVLAEASQYRDHHSLGTASLTSRLKTAFQPSTDKAPGPLDQAVLRLLDRLPDAPQKQEIQSQWRSLQADTEKLTPTAGSEQVAAVLRRYAALSVRMQEVAHANGQETALPRPVFVVGGLADVLADVQGQIQHKIADARLIAAAFAQVSKDGLFKHRVERLSILNDHRRVRHELHKLVDFGEEVRELYVAPGVDFDAGRTLIEEFVPRMERFTEKSTAFVGEAQKRIEWRAANLVVAAGDSTLRQQLTLWMNIVNSAGSAASVGLLPTGFSWAPATVTFATDFARVAVLHGVEHVQTRRVQADQSNDQIYDIHNADPLTAARAQAQAFKDYFKLLLEGIEIGANVWPAWPLLQGTVNTIVNEAIDARVRHAERELTGENRPTAVQTLEGLWSAFREEAKEKFSDAGAWKTIAEAIKGGANAYGVTGSFASLLVKPLAEKVLDYLPMQPASIVTGTQLRTLVDGLGSLSTENTVRPQPTAAPPIQSDPFRADMPRRDQFGRSVDAYRAADFDGRLFTVALNFYGSQVWGKLDRKGIFSPERVDRSSFVDDATVQERIIGRNSYREDNNEVRGTWYQPFKNQRTGAGRNDYLFVRDSDGGWEWFHEMSVPAHATTGRDNLHHTFLAHPDWITPSDFEWNPPADGHLVVPFVGNRLQLNQQVHQLAAWTAHKILDDLDGAPQSRPKWHMEAGAIGSRVRGQISDWKQRLGRSKTANPKAEEASHHRAVTMRDEFYRLIDRQLEQQATERGIAPERLPSAHDFLADPIARGAGLAESRAPEQLKAVAAHAAEQRHSDQPSLTQSSDLGLVWVDNLVSSSIVRPDWLDAAEQHLTPAGAIPDAARSGAAPATASRAVAAPQRTILTAQARDAAQTAAAEAVSEAWQFRQASPEMSDVALVRRIKTAVLPPSGRSDEPSLHRRVSDVLDSLPDSADKSAVQSAWNGVQDDTKALAPGAASIRTALNSYAHVYAWLDVVVRDTAVANPLPRPLAVVAGLADGLAIALAQVERKIQDGLFLAGGMQGIQRDPLFRDHPVEVARTFTNYRRARHEQHKMEDYSKRLRPLYGMTAEGVADARKVLTEFPDVMAHFTTTSSHLSKEVQRDIEWLAVRSVAGAADTRLKQRVDLGMNFLNSGMSAMSMAMAPTGWGWAPATTTFLTDLARTAVMRGVEHADAKHRDGDVSAAAIFAMHDEDPLTVAKAQYETAKTLFRLTLEAIEIGAHIFPGWPLIPGTLIPAFDTFINAKLKEAERLAAGKPKPTLEDVLPTGWKGFIEEAKSRFSDAGVWKTIVEGGKGGATPYGWAGAFAAQLVRPLIESVLDMLPMKPASQVTGAELMAKVDQLGGLSTAGTVQSQPTTAPPMQSEPIPAALAGKRDQFGRRVLGYRAGESDQHADHVALDFNGSLVWGKLDRRGGFTPESVDPSSMLDNATLQNRVLTRNSYIEAGSVEVRGTWHLPFHTPERPKLDYLFVRDSDGGWEWFPAMGVTGGGKTSTSHVHAIISDEKHEGWVSAERFDWNPRVPAASVVRFEGDHEPRLNLRTHQMIAHFAHRVIEKHEVEKAGGDAQDMPRIHVEAGALGSRFVGQISEWKLRLGRSEVENPQAESYSAQRAMNLRDQVARLVGRQLEYQATARNIPLNELPSADDLVADWNARGAGLDHSVAPEALRDEARGMATHQHRDSVSLTDSSDLGLVWADNLETTVRERPEWFGKALRHLAQSEADRPNVFVVASAAVAGDVMAAARQAQFVQSVREVAASHPRQIFIAVDRRNHELEMTSIRRTVRAVQMFASSQEMLPQADRQMPVVVVRDGLGQNLLRHLAAADLDVPVVHMVTDGLFGRGWRVTRSGKVPDTKDLTDFNLAPAVGMARSATVAVDQVAADLAPWFNAVTSADRKAAPAPDYENGDHRQLVERWASRMPGHRDIQLAKAAFTVGAAHAQPDLVHRIAEAAEKHDAGGSGLEQHDGIGVVGEALIAIVTRAPEMGKLTAKNLNEVIAGSAAEYEAKTPEADNAAFTQNVVSALHTLESKEHVGQELSDFLADFDAENRGKLHDNPALRNRWRDFIGNYMAERGDALSIVTKVSMEALQAVIFKC